MIRFIWPVCVPHVNPFVWFGASVCHGPVGRGASSQETGNSRKGENVRVNRAGLEQQEQRVFGSVAWQPQRALDLDEWVYHGVRLGAIGRGVAWWIGDWVNYGNARFGEKYVRAARITGYDLQSLMNMAYVASRFGISRRRENLSWSHHAEVAPLSEPEQELWLNIAAERRLSVRSFRAELRAWRSERMPRRGGTRTLSPGRLNGDSARVAQQEQQVPEQSRRELDQQPALPGRDTSPRQSDVRAADIPHRVVCPQCGYMVETHVPN